MSNSQLFVGYRALGFVSNGVPFCIGYYHTKKEAYIVTCIGRAFHVYNVKQLAIISIGDTLDETITCLKVDKKFIYAAAGNTIFAFMQLRKICHTFKGHAAKVHSLLPFSDHLISVDVENNLKVWNIDTTELFLEITFSDFHITCLIHPHYYVNKVLLASQEGSLKLFNLKKNKIVFTYAGWGSPVSTVQQSPAIDVVGIGLNDGRIILLNLKLDEVLMQFQQDWGIVTCISFRTDDQPIMVTGSQHGHVAIWNLEEQKLQSQINLAHLGPVSAVYCLENQPLLVTNSSDNSLKIWIFDQPDGGARLYHVRSGHSQPPTMVRYHDNDGQTILSAGKDSTLRSFSIIHDSLNKSLGVAIYNKKRAKKEGVKSLIMPHINHFVSETSRQSDWDGILACHLNESTSTTWNFNRSSMGDHKLKPISKLESFSGGMAAQCVCVTSCGNFGLIGYQSGNIEVFNLQSGLHRGTYGKKTAHNGCVVGVHTNSINSHMISCGRDAKVKFWKFKTRQFINELMLSCTPTKSLLFRDNGNLAVALDDYSIVIIDIETKRVIRKLAHHENTITDMSFTDDGRWLISSSMDCHVMVFDLMSGILIEKILMVSPVTSLCMSPTGTYLATTHVDDLGIYLWFNRSLFKTNRTFGSTKNTSELQLPSTEYKSADMDDSDAKDLNIESSYETCPQINNYLTLSNVPSTRWSGLLNIDIIKERNKAKEPLRVPKSAPFFLPTTPGLNLAFTPLQPDEITERKSIQQNITNSLLNDILDKYSKEPLAHFDTLLGSLKEMSISLLDLQLRLIQDSVQRVNFLTFICDGLNRKISFEFISALLNRFLKIHGEDILNDDNLEVTDLLIELRNAQKHTNNLDTCISSISCLLAYNRGCIL